MAKQWPKGVSGNPNGRPKVDVEFRARARKAVDEYVLGKWVAEVETDGPEWVKCSELLAAYGYGRPAQSLEVIADVVTHDETPPLTNDERRAVLTAQLKGEQEALNR